MPCRVTWWAWAPKRRSFVTKTPYYLVSAVTTRKEKCNVYDSSCALFAIGMLYYLQSQSICDAFLILSNASGVVDERPIGRQKDGGRKERHFTVVHWQAIQAVGENYHGLHVIGLQSYRKQMNNPASYNPLHSFVYARYAAPLAAKVITVKCNLKYGIQSVCYNDWNSIFESSGTRPFVSIRALESLQFQF